MRNNKEKYWDWEDVCAVFAVLLLVCLCVFAAAELVINRVTEESDKIVSSVQGEAHATRYRELPSYLEICSQGEEAAFMEDIKLEKGDCFSVSTTNGLKRFTLRGKLFTVSLQDKLHAKSRLEPDSVVTGERVNFEGGATGIVSGWMDKEYGYAIIVSMNKD